MLDGSTIGEIASGNKEEDNLTFGEIHATNATTSAVAAKNVRINLSNSRIVL